MKSSSTNQNATVHLKASPYSCFTSFSSKDAKANLGVELSSSSSSEPIPLVALTVDIIQTYKKCNPQFKASHQQQHRLLTQPAVPAGNKGFDNSEANLIVHVYDEIYSQNIGSVDSINHNSTYIVLDIVGTGTFGQVFRCQNKVTKEIFAVKVIKNKPAYHMQAA